MTVAEKWQRLYEWMCEMGLHGEMLKRFGRFSRRGEKCSYCVVILLKGESLLYRIVWRGILAQMPDKGRSDPQNPIEEIQIEVLSGKTSESLQGIRWEDLAASFSPEDVIDQIAQFCKTQLGRINRMTIAAESTLRAVKNRHYDWRRLGIVDFVAFTHRDDIRSLLPCAMQDLERGISLGRNDDGKVQAVENVHEVTLGFPGPDIDFTPNLYMHKSDTPCEMSKARLYAEISVLEQYDFVEKTLIRGLWEGLKEASMELARIQPAGSAHGEIQDLIMLVQRHSVKRGVKLE